MVCRANRAEVSMLMGYHHINGHNSGNRQYT